MIITITGEPCSGKSTLADNLARHLDYKLVKTGELFRQKANELNMSVVELHEYIKNNPDCGIDDEIDNMLASLKGNCVVDSRLAFHFIPSSFKIYLVNDEEMAIELMEKRNTLKLDMIDGVNNPPLMP